MASTNTPWPGDYDGDGKAALTVWHAMAGILSVRYSTTQTVAQWFAERARLGYGLLPGDDDSDGKCDVA